MENSRYLIFTSAGRSFSLPFEDIKIIIAAQTPTPVPDFPDYVPGTVVNEGEVVPVIDLRRFSKRRISSGGQAMLCP